MNKFERIREKAQAFTREVDIITASYTQKMNEAKEKFNEKAFAEEQRKAQAFYREKIENERNKAKAEMDLLLSGIEQDIKNWLSEPITSDVLNLLSTIYSTKIKMTVSEIRMFAEQYGGNLIAHRILEQIANDNGVRLPEIKTEQWFALIGRVRTEINNLINGYTGKNTLPELTSPHMYNGNKINNTQPTHVLALASKIFKPNSALEEAIALWGDGIVPATRAKEELTDSERERIDQLYMGYEGQLSSRTRDIICINPDMEQKLLLSEYAEFCPHFGL